MFTPGVNKITYGHIVRDSSAVRRLFVRLAGAVGRQSALHKENSGFAAPTKVGTFPRFVAIGFYFLSETLIWIASPIIVLFIHNLSTLRKWCYTPLQRDFPLDPMISSFWTLSFWNIVTLLRENCDYRNVSWEMICIYDLTLFKIGGSIAHALSEPRG